MEFPVNLQEFGVSRRITVEAGGFFSHSQLLVDGATAQRGSRQGEFLLPKDDGSMLAAQIRGVMLDPVPIVEVGGRRVYVAEPFTVLQTLASALSFLVALSMSIAGIIFMPRLSNTQGIQLVGYLCMTINVFMGVLLGGTSMIINRRILRSDMSRSSQIFSIGALNIIVIIGFLVTFLLLVGIISVFQGLEQPTSWLNR